MSEPLERNGILNKQKNGNRNELWPGSVVRHHLTNRSKVAHYTGKLRLHHNEINKLC